MSDFALKINDENAVVSYTGVLPSHLIIPDGVEEIKPFVFCNEKNLETVCIPASCTTIGESAFRNTGLEKVEYFACCGRINENAFSHNRKLKTVHMPNFNGMIAEYGFAFSALEELQLPRKAVLESSAFCGCDALQEGNDFVIINSVLVKYRGKDANVVIPSRVAIIGERAFYGNDSIESLHVDGNVFYVGRHAFMCCNHLKQVESFRGLSLVQRFAFALCPKLTDVHITSKYVIFYEGVFYDDVLLCKDNMFVINDWLVLVHCKDDRDVTLQPPEGVVYIGGRVLSRAAQARLQSIKLPQSCKKVRNYAFYNAKALVKLDLGGTQYIEEAAFANCTKLQLLLLRDVYDVEEKAFYNCSSLEEVHAGESLACIRKLAFARCTKLRCVVLPNIKFLCEGAFRDDTSLMVCSLSNHRVMIGDRCFANCSKLEMMMLPDGTHIGEYAFLNCASLRVLYYPKEIYKISEGAFMGCTSLEEIHLGEHVMDVGANAFRNCSQLKQVEVKAAKQIRFIGAGAFQGCLQLASIDFIRAARRIDARAFYDCVQLKRVVLGERLESLGNEAFLGCRSLKEVIFSRKSIKLKTLPYGAFAHTAVCSVKLPSYVESLGEMCFFSCRDLCHVKLGKKTKKIGEQCFAKCPKLSADKELTFYQESNR